MIYLSEKDIKHCGRCSEDTQDDAIGRGEEKEIHEQDGGQE